MKIDNGPGLDGRVHASMSATLHVLAVDGPSAGVVAAIQTRHAGFGRAQTGPSGRDCREEYSGLPKYPQVLLLVLQCTR